MTSLDYQGIGPRLIAQIIDGVILFILYFIVGAAMFGALTFDVYGAAAVSFMGIYGLLGFLYFLILEGLRGATVGKMLMKIKVVREDGSAYGFGPALIRNILRIIDVLPFLYIIGLILISRSDKKQRLGDRIAKTVVIKSSQAPSQAQSSAVPAPQANRFCANCGAELSASSPFCPKCGAKQ